MRDIGSVETSVTAASARFAVIGRAIVVLACTALLPVGAFTASSAAMVVAVLAWQVAFVTATGGGSGPQPRLRRVAAVDGAMVAALCVLLPYAHLPHGYLGLDDWTRPVISVVVVTVQWYTSPRAGALLTLLIAAAVVGGSALVTGDDWDLSTADDAVTLLWQAGLSRCLALLVARGARRVDELTGAVATWQRTAQLATARRADVEVDMAMLHDTVAATLTAAASRGTGGLELRRRAQADLSLLAAQLRPAGSHDPVSDLTTPRTTGSVRVTMVLLGPSSNPDRLAEALRKLPAEAVGALVGARDEALRNVERHAGTDRARVELRLPAAGGVELNVVDDGHGFHPGQGDGGPHFGLRLSIEARMRRAGGSARVVSAPGRGTRVELRWPEASPSADVAAGAPRARVGVDSADWERT